MSKHTPIPWFKNEYRQIFGPNGRRICIDGFAFGTHSTEESQANTRRVIACINACEGFSDEELEGADLFKDSIESQSEIVALKQQRDELLAAVQYAADVFAEYVALHKAKGAAGAEKAQSNQHHLQVMLEAIAKAGGES